MTTTPNRASRLILLATSLLLGACTAPAPTRALTDADVTAIADSVRAAILAFTSDSASCRNHAFVLSYYRFPQSGFLWMEDTLMANVTETDARAMIEQALCAQRSNDATIDSIQVRVLGRGIAIAGYRFTEQVVDTSGKVTRVTGQVFGPWVRDSAGWGIAAGMSAHTPLQPAP